MKDTLAIGRQIHWFHLQWSCIAWLHIVELMYIKTMYEIIHLHQKGMEI